MKHIEFNEGEFLNFHEVGAALFSNPQDPSSNDYKRELVRPKINWLLVAINCLLPPILAVGIFFALVYYADIKFNIAIAISIALFVLCIIVNLKRTIIGAVRIYQRYAPDSLRNKCRFEPSCSQYMILSLQKYGLIKGLYKGIGRLKRCNIHHGGYDMP